MIKLTNKSGGLIVCDLKSKNKNNVKTLRLNNNQSTTCSEDEITKHIENLISKGLVRKDVIKSTEKVAAKGKEE